MHYTGTVWRPPFEFRSLLLQVTTGCSHNGCSFCSMYRKTPFHVSPMEEVRSDLKEAALRFPETERVFLLSGDAFVLPAERLLEIAEEAHKALPKLKTISCYASVQNVKNKTVRELKALRAAGINEPNFGIETGLPSLLKDMNKNNILGTSAYGYSDASLMIQSVDLTNEMFTIKSPVVISEIVRRLNLQMQYEIEGRFRNSVLYGSNLPIEVKMLEAKDEETCSVSVSFESDSTFVLNNFVRNGRLFEGVSLSGQLSKTLTTPIGNVVVSASPYYYKPSMPIIATHLRAQAALAKYSGELKVTSESGSTIINMTVTDHDTQRAEEFLYSLIAIYNEQWMNDRNQVSISTNQFISERLNVIENELGNVDSSISDYKSDNLIIGNAESMAGMYVNQAQSANTQIISYNNQLYLARSLRTYLTTESNYMQLLPALWMLGVVGGFTIDDDQFN